jgi:bacillithiol system protein YtxJ
MRNWITRWTLAGGLGIFLFCAISCGKETKEGEIVQLKTSADFEALLKESDQQLVFIFKHSTSCPVSAKAYAEFQAFVQKKPQGVSFAMVRVIEERPLSQEIAQRLSVQHKSPQLLLLRQGKVLWHDSHFAITREKIDAVLQKNLL